MGSSVIQSTPPPNPHPAHPSEILAPLLPGFDGAVAARMLFSGALHSFPHRVSGSLKHSLPLLSLCALCSAYFCDLHVAEILVELNYFYTSLFMWPAFRGLFPLAGGWERSVH